MSKLEQAARQALEAWQDPQGMPKLCKAMDALREALEQPAHTTEKADREAFISWHMEYLRTDEMLAAHVWDKDHVVAEAWKAARKAPHPAQEPVAWQVMVEDEAMKEFSIKDMAHDWCVQQKLSGSPYTYWIRPLYTRPQQREWVGLTDEDIQACGLDLFWPLDEDAPKFARDIEAALKERNQL